MGMTELFQRMKKYVINLSLSLLLLQVSCVAQHHGYTSSDAFSEDLTSVRPNYEVEKNDSIIESYQVVKERPVMAATNTVNTKVDLVLDSLSKLNQQRKFFDGFTIQIYSGQNREEALSTRSKVVKDVNDLEANIQYTQPKFRVTVGRYFTKLEAQKDLKRLRRYFSNAILVPEKIQIK